MKLNIDGVIVVEGKSDVSYLSSFLNTLFFITNGYDLNSKKLEFLKRVSEVSKLIVLTDPDDAGKVIRNKLTSQINNCFVVEISGKSRNNYIKNGVAESNRDELISVLKPYMINTELNLIDYNINQMILDNNSNRDFKKEIIDKYRLISNTTKSIEKELNMLKISKEEIEEFWRELQ